MPNFIGSLDQGTTSTRFMIFSHEGAVVSSHQLEHAQIYPQPGWVEHDPMEIWDKSQEVIRVGMSQAGISADEIAALGITNQRETTILWNRFTGKQYHNAIVWQDTRTSSLCDQLAKEGGQDRFREKTGLPLATYFSGPKIRWLLENLPGLREEAEAGDVLFGTIDSWLIWNLTGGAHVTDVTNASRTMLMNLGTLDWDEELLSILEVPRVMLPEIKPSSTPNPYGYTLADGPFQGEVPICGNLGDQQAALFGQTCFRPGEAKNTYGTGCFMLINTGSQIIPSRSGLLTTVGYKIGDEDPVYALEGSIAISGALIQWLRDNLGVISSADEVEALAETVPDNGGIYFVPAFSGLFAPYWKSDARGVIVGMTGHTNKGHIARAALEATAFQTLEVLNAMEKDSGVVLKSLKVDGGMVVNNLLMQFQADVLGVPVMRPIVHETTALGAAYAAGLAVGFWEDTDELRQHWKVDKEWQPQMEQQTRDELIKNWLKAVTRTFDWVE